MIIYYSLQIVGIVLGFVYLFIFIPKYGLNMRKTLLGTIIMVSICYLLTILLYRIVKGVWGGQNLVRMMAFFPLVVLLVAKLLKLPVKKVLDLVAPVPCIIQSIAKIGCQYVGCCYSQIEVNWGFYNRIKEVNLFPIQLLEGIVAGSIAAFLIVRSIKNKYNTQGLNLPLGLVLFGITRFLLEFLRNNRKLFLGISELAIWAFSIAIIGVGWLCIVWKKRIVKK